MCHRRLVVAAAVGVVLGLMSGPRLKAQPSENCTSYPVALTKGKQTLTANNDYWGTSTGIGYWSATFNCGRNVGPNSGSACGLCVASYLWKSTGVGSPSYTGIYNTYTSAQQGCNTTGNVVKYRTRGRYLNAKALYTMYGVCINSSQDGTCPDYNTNQALYNNNGSGVSLEFQTQ